MSRVQRVVVSFGAITFALLAFPLAAQAAVDPAVVQGGVGYLATTQRGGLDPSTGAGAWDATVAAGAFNTFDAVLGIAEAGQTGTTWSTSQAFVAVDNFENAQGVDPLGYMDLIGNAATTPGRAGKIITLWAEPLGLSPTDFDPADNGGGVDLVAKVGSPMPNGAYADDLDYSDTLYAILATHLVGGTISPTSVQYIRDGQTAEGSWAYNHDPTDAVEADNDTTSLSIQALIAAGVPATDPAVVDGLAYIAAQQMPDGRWSAFGFPSSESTSRALLGIAAAGFDVNSRCWRDTVLPSASTDAFVGGDAALSSFAQSDGSIADPSSFGPTYSTAQSLEGLLRNWLPVVSATAQNCSVPVTPVTPVAPVDPSAPAPAVAVAPHFTG